MDPLYLTPPVITGREETPVRVTEDSSGRTYFPSPYRREDALDDVTPLLERTSRRDYGSESATATSGWESPPLIPSPQSRSTQLSPSAVIFRKDIKNSKPKATIDLSPSLSDVEVVGFVKSMAERTPVEVTLSSDEIVSDDADIVLESRKRRRKKQEERRRAATPLGSDAVAPLWSTASSSTTSLKRRRHKGRPSDAPKETLVIGEESDEVEELMHKRGEVVIESGDDDGDDDVIIDEPQKTIPPSIAVASSVIKAKVWDFLESARKEREEREGRRETNGWDAEEEEEEVMRQRHYDDGVAGDAENSRRSSSSKGKGKGKGKKSTRDSNMESSSPSDASSSTSTPPVRDETDTKQPETPIRDCDGSEPKQLDESTCDYEDSTDDSESVNEKPDLKVQVDQEETSKRTNLSKAPKLKSVVAFSSFKEEPREERRDRRRKKEKRKRKEDTRKSRHTGERDNRVIEDDDRERGVEDHAKRKRGDV